MISVYILLSIPFIRAYPLIPSLCPPRCSCFATSVQCRGVPLYKIPPPLLENVQKLQLSDCNCPKLDLNLLENSTDLQVFIVNNCQVEAVHLRVKLPITTLILSRNYLQSWHGILNILEHLPALNHLDLSRNALEEYQDGHIDEYLKHQSHLNHIDMSSNCFTRIPSLPSNVISLNLSYNSVKQLKCEELPPTLTILDLSHNSIKDTIPQQIPLHNLEVFHLSHNNLYNLDFLNYTYFSKLSKFTLNSNPIQRADALQWLNPELKLKSIDLSDTFIQYFDFAWIKTVQNFVDLSNNHQLVTINGSLKDVFAKKVNLKGCDLTSFPVSFFSGGPRMIMDLSENPLACDCRLEWIQNVPEHIQLIGNCSSNDKSLSTEQFSANSLNNSCNIGSSTQNGSIVRVKYGQSALLKCEQYGKTPVTITWDRWHLNENDLLAEWDSESGWTRFNASESEVSLLPNGILLFKNVYKEDVGRYACTASNSHGSSLTYILLRLDYSSWLIWVKLMSVVAGVVAMVLSIVLHTLWTILRTCVLWRIRTKEKRSRVRKMLEAMEKYRMKQIETIHDKYVQRMNGVRENYNQQCEQLRQSYATRVDRFRDYRSAQMDAAWQTLDNMREQYNSQVDRLREYGGRNMDRLYDGYQRQINRVRTFSLQQRLKLMRQYKVKQRYLNKLVDGLNLNEIKESRPPSRSLYEPQLLDRDKDLYEAFALARLARGDDDNLSVTTYHSLPDMEIQDLAGAAEAFGVDLSILENSPSTSHTTPVCTPNSGTEGKCSVNAARRNSEIEILCFDQTSL